MRRSRWLLFALCCLPVLVSCSEEDCPSAPSLFNGVADLEVVDTGLTSLTLEWTAPVAQGANLSYDIRYLDAVSMGGETVLTEALWAVADTVDGEPMPSHAGYEQSYVIEGLPRGVDHFAAIRVVRASDGATSDISNTVSATTDPGTAWCSWPNLSIPDNNPGGVIDVISFPYQIEIEEVLVEIELTHTWIGDLLIDLMSPSGTIVRLHNLTGGSSDNIIGTYGLDLTVDGPGSLADFTGELSAGNWTLWVSDNAGWDLGTLVSWCVIVGGDAS